jgi:citrate lyase subunit beta/citryl-CoA lyase
MRLRRTMLFIPGNNPGMLQNGGLFGADSVILDLEDAVAPQEKDAARWLVAEALKTVAYGSSEKVVRINPLDTFGVQDIQALVPCQPNVLLVPKVESVEDIEAVTALVVQAEKAGQTPVQIIALLETSLGIAQAHQIAQTKGRLVALALGAEDYTAGLGATRTKEGREIFTARSLVINAAAAAGIQSLDTPFTDANDEVGLYQDTLTGKELGFKGKLAINPRQLDVIHSVYNPTLATIEWAGEVVQAIRKAEAEGSGVASLHGKMVDAPIVARAEQILELAKRLGMEGVV